MHTQGHGKTHPQNPIIDWTFLLEAAPPIIWRHRWDHYAERLGLPYRRATMQNFDYRPGQGPAKIYLGNRVGYTREALVEWLQTRQRAAA
ncbi:MAG: hypothetical protein WAW37_13570 [Syntrophobacteraceae bacterium]